MTMTMKRSFGFLAVVAVAALLAACGSSSSGGSGGGGSSGGGSGGSKSPIVVGVEAPFSGDYAIYGEGYLRGIAAWEAQNGQPTVGGRKVQIKNIDDQCSVGTAVAAFRRVATQLTAVLGPSCSAEGPALAPLLAADHVPALDLGHAASITLPYHGGWFFRMTQPDAPNQYAFAQYLLPLWKKQGITKLGLIYDTTTTDAGAAKSWTQAAKSQGDQLVASQPFQEGATDFTSEILKIKNAGAQAVVLQVYGPDESNIIHQMTDLKVKIPIASAEDTPYPFVINKQTGPGIEGVWFYSDYIHGSGKQPLTAFEQSFDKLHPGRIPMDIDWEGYLAMDVLMHALKQPGAASGGTNLQKALQQTNLPLGDLPAVTFLPNGDQTNTLTYVGRVQNMKPVFKKLLVQPRKSFPDWSGQ